MPPLSPETKIFLTPLLPSFLPPKNPLDLGTQTIWQPEPLETCVDALLRDPAIGGACDFDSGHQSAPLRYLRQGHRGRERVRNPWRSRILGDGSPLSPEFMDVVRKNNVVLSRSSDRTLRAMGKVTGYGNRNTALAVRNSRAGRRPRSRVGAARSRNGSARRFCAPSAAGAGRRTCPLRRRGLNIAERIGYPVAMKAQAARLRTRPRRAASSAASPMRRRAATPGRRCTPMSGARGRD